MNNVVTLDGAGENAQPSSNVWAGCPGARLLAEGSGILIHEDFVGGVVSTTTTAATPIGNGFLTFAGDVATVTSFKAGEIGGYLDVETDGDDNDGAALVTQPIIRFERHSGKEVWLEARLELGALADQGVFVGFAEAAGLTHDVIADGAAALIGESLVGFQILNDDTDAVDAVFKLDAGAAVEMGSVLNPTPLVADTEFKVGLRFDGRETIKLFFNGDQVVAYNINAATFPVNVDMGFVVAVKTGAAAARSIAIDWVRVAHQSIL